MAEFRGSVSFRIVKNFPNQTGSPLSETVHPAIRAFVFAKSHGAEIGFKSQTPRMLKTKPRLSTEESSDTYVRFSLRLKCRCVSSGLASQPEHRLGPKANFHIWVRMWWPVRI